MNTVVRRVVRSTPYRDSAQTWSEIVALLTRGEKSEAHQELLNIAGIASSVIADQSPKTAPIVVTCDGPRTRIYCIYDESALDGAEADEASLAFDPLKGDWKLSLPCAKSDLDWVAKALKKHTERVTARDLSEGFAVETEIAKTEPLTVNLEGLKK